MLVDDLMNSLVRYIEHLSNMLHRIPSNPKLPDQVIAIPFVVWLRHTLDRSRGVRSLVLVVAEVNPSSAGVVVDHVLSDQAHDLVGDQRLDMFRNRLTEQASGDAGHVASKAFDFLPGVVVLPDFLALVVSLLVELLPPTSTAGVVPTNNDAFFAVVVPAQDNPTHSHSFGGPGQAPYLSRLFDSSSLHSSVYARVSYLTPEVLGLSLGHLYSSDAAVPLTVVDGIEADRARRILIYLLRFLALFFALILL
jgi:hypothetical protein